MLETIELSFNSTKSKLPYYSNELLFPGLYCFSLNNFATLTDIAQPNETIYIGKAEDSLLCRLYCQHLSINRTNQSTFRRSLGAILREELSLQAIPGSKNKTKGSITRYRFIEDGEIKLSDWIVKHIKVGFYVNGSDNLWTNEIELIKKIKPILNTTYNPRRDELREKLRILKKYCRDEARQY